MIPSREEMLRALELKHGTEMQKKISAAAVAVCGLGGLGSNIAVSLARAGVGKLILIDFDRIDVTNLQRQQYKASQVGMPKAVAMMENLKEIAPYVNVETHTARIDADNAAELISGADIVCEAFDNAESKATLAEAVLGGTNKYLVAASGMAGIGSANDIRTRKISERFYLCGDGVSDVNETAGLFSSRVMLCAAHQAHTVLRLIAGIAEP